MCARPQTTRSLRSHHQLKSVRSSEKSDGFINWLVLKGLTWPGQTSYRLVVSSSICIHKRQKWEMHARRLDYLCTQDECSETHSQKKNSSEGMMNSRANDIIRGFSSVSGPQTCITYQFARKLIAMTSTMANFKALDDLGWDLHSDFLIWNRAESEDDLRPDFRCFWGRLLGPNLWLYSRISQTCVVKLLELSWGALRVLAQPKWVSCNLMPLSLSTFTGFIQTKPTQAQLHSL